MSLLSGWLLFLLNIWLPLRTAPIQGNSRLTKAVLIVMGMHQLVTALQVFWRPLPTVDVDPMSFNHTAETGEGRLVINSYAMFLHFLYTWFGGSHFLGCQVSQFGFSVAIIFFAWILRELDLLEEGPVLLLIWGLPISFVLNTSVVMREAWQMAAFTALAFGLLDLRKNGLRSQSYYVIGTSSVLLMWLHNGLPAFVLAFVPLAVLWATKSRPIVMVSVFVLSFLLALMLGGQLWKKLERKSFFLQSVGQGQGLKYVTKYATRVDKSRSEFALTLDLSSPTGFLVTGPMVALEYLFSPMPWQITNGMDIYANLENFLRLALFVGAFKLIRGADGQRRDQLLFLFVMFLAMEMVWAAGTANWGTAFRHRVVAYALLVIVGGPWLLAKLAGKGGSGSYRNRVRSGRGLAQPATRSEVRRKRQELIRAQTWDGKQDNPP